MNKKGFTLLEILLVLALMSLLITVLYTSFSKINGNQALDKDAKQVAALIEDARSRTLFSKNDTQYGVHFETTQVTLFSGATYSSTSPSNELVKLNNLVNIYNINLTGGGSDMIFDRLTGNTSQPGVISFYLVTGTSSKAYLTVAGTGLVEISK
jgi:prepilin-type N-terminal cleavage/methylation domain-containing protein